MNYFPIDVDECAVGDGGCSHTCTNSLGSHQCSCPSGLELSWDKSRCISKFKFLVVLINGNLVQQYTVSTYTRGLCIYTRLGN